MAEVAAAEPVRFHARRVMLIAVVFAVVGLAVTLVGLWVDAQRALFAYLFAYVTVIAIAIGGLILLMIGYASNARWFAVVRRLQEALVVTFPILAVLFVPIAIGVRWIYPWARPGAVLPPAEVAAIQAKGAYLEPSTFILRSALYLVVFLVAGELLRRYSRQRDAVIVVSDPEVEMSRERKFSSAMLPIVGLALTFASFDWLMSLQPRWYSTMFGVYLFGAGFDAAIALLAILAWRIVRRDPAVLYTGNHFHAIGRLMFAFVVFWAYAAYFQGFLIQIANKPVEVTFFVMRTNGGWGWVILAVVLTRFAVPFFLLLPRSWKFHAWFMGAVGALILVGHVLDMYWLVLPVVDAQLSPSWLDFAALAGVAGAAVAFAAWRMDGLPVLAAGDPYVGEGLHYASPS